MKQIASRRKWRRGVLGLLTITSLGLTGLTACIPPSQYVEEPVEMETTVPTYQVYFSPNLGQSLEKQDRDSYECYLWARKQTGFDPSAPNLAPHTRVAVVPEPPPGTDTAIGAVTGAMLGAVVASRGNRPEGALIGALAGGLVGGAADAARQEEAARLQGQYDRRSDQRLAVIERQSSDYRRALTACLEGRGYTVR
jgi:hypothetical protein